MRAKERPVIMSWTFAFLLIGFWVFAFLNGCSFGGIIHILLVYAGLVGFARFLQRGRPGGGPPRVK